MRCVRSVGQCFVHPAMFCHCLTLRFLCPCRDQHCCSVGNTFPFALGENLTPDMFFQLFCKIPKKVSGVAGNTQKTYENMGFVAQSDGNGPCDTVIVSENRAKSRQEPAALLPLSG